MGKRESSTEGESAVGRGGGSREGRKGLRGVKKNYMETPNQWDVKIMEHFLKVWIGNRSIARAEKGSAGVNCVQISLFPAQLEVEQNVIQILLVDRKLLRHDLQDVTQTRLLIRKSIAVTAATLSYTLWEVATSKTPFHNEISPS